MIARTILPELTEILTAHQQGQARSLQRKIGPSEIGEPCDRALAYRLAEIPPVANDDPLKWAPLVGTWGHEGLATALDDANKRLGRERYLVERRVTVSEALGIHGVTDAYDMDEDEVIDWKFVGKTRRDHYRRHGPGGTYRIQAHLYARGWELAGFTPRTVRIVFLPKWSHLLTDLHEWSEPYDRDVAIEALERLHRTQTLLDVLDARNKPDGLALVAATPGDDGCRYCKWHRPWPSSGAGPADETGCPGLPTTK